MQVRPASIQSPPPKLRHAGFRCLALCSVLAIASGLSISTDAADRYFRWKDERGNMVISDRPPAAGIDYEVVSSGSSRPGRTDTAASARDTTPRSEGRGRQGEGDAPEPMETVAVEVLPEKDPEICERARQNLQILEDAARIRVNDADGELRYLTDDERATQRENALDNIDVHC